MKGREGITNSENIFIRVAKELNNLYIILLRPICRSYYIEIANWFASEWSC